MKKGFTLIELLGTIIILSAIILIVAPLVVNEINEGKKQLDNQNDKNLILIAKNWADDNKDLLPDNNEKGCIYSSILNSEGYMNDSQVDGGVLISNKDGVYYYEYSNNVNCREYALVDNTAPVIEKVQTTSTTSTITVTVSAHEEESLIASYDFSIDAGKSWVNVETDKEKVSYTFTKLTDNVLYDQIVIKVTNRVGTFSEQKTEEKTKLLQVPDVQQQSKNGLIDYKKQCSKEIECSYEKNQSGFKKVDNNTEINFSENGILVAKVSDGTNTESSSLTVIITKDAYYHNSYYYCNSGYTLSGTKCSKQTSKNASYSSGYYSCPSGYTKSGSICTKIDSRHVTGSITCNGYNGSTANTDNSGPLIASGYSCSISCGSCAGQKQGVVKSCSGTCRKNISISATYHSGYYYCSSGYTLSGNMCYSTVTVDANYAPGYYYCDDNFTLSGSTCTIK